MSASDFHVYNCCLPKSLTAWGDCKIIILRPPVAVDSASPLFEAPSINIINWGKKLFFCTCLFAWQRNHPVIHAPFMFLWWSFCWFWSTCRASLCFWSSWEQKANQKLGVSTINTKHISQPQPVAALPSVPSPLQQQQNCELWWFKCTSIKWNSSKA